MSICYVLDPGIQLCSKQTQAYSDKCCVGKRCKEKRFKECRGGEDFSCVSVVGKTILRFTFELTYEGGKEKSSSYREQQVQRP